METKISQRKHAKLACYLLIGREYYCYTYDYILVRIFSYIIHNHIIKPWIIEKSAV